MSFTDVMKINLCDQAKEWETKRNTDYNAAHQWQSVPDRAELQCFIQLQYFFPELVSIAFFFT